MDRHVGRSYVDLHRDGHKNKNTQPRAGWRPGEHGRLRLCDRNWEAGGAGLAEKWQNTLRSTALSSKFFLKNHTKIDRRSQRSSSNIHTPEYDFFPFEQIQFVFTNFKILERTRDENRPLRIVFGVFHFFPKLCVVLCQSVVIATNEKTISKRDVCPLIANCTLYQVRTY